MIDPPRLAKSVSLAGVSLAGEQKSGRLQLPDTDCMPSEPLQTVTPRGPVSHPGKSTRYSEGQKSVRISSGSEQSFQGIGRPPPLCASKSLADVTRKAMKAARRGSMASLANLKGLFSEKEKTIAASVLQAGASNCGTYALVIAAGWCK